MFQRYVLLGKRPSTAKMLLCVGMVRLNGIRKALEVRDARPKEAGIVATLEPTDWGRSQHGCSAVPANLPNNFAQHPFIRSHLFHPLVDRHVAQPSACPPRRCE